MYANKQGKFTKVHEQILQEKRTKLFKGKENTLCEMINLHKCIFACLLKSNTIKYINKNSYLTEPDTCKWHGFARRISETAYELSTKENCPLAVAATGSFRPSPIHTIFWHKAKQM